MSINRMSTWLLACGAVVLLTARALAQPANSNLDYQTPRPSYENGSAPYSDSVPAKHRPLLPLGPMDIEPTADPFGPAETSGYGNGPRPHIGWFASYERLFWSLSRPKTALVGIPDPVPPLVQFPGGPTVDTSFIGAIGAWGNRWELGYIDDDNYGWMVGVLDHVSQGQFEMKDSPQINFGDPQRLLSAAVIVPIPNDGSAVVEIGELPTKFSALQMKNVTVLNGVELTRFYRASRLHSGGFFELLYGARWFQIDDAFSVFASGNGLRREFLGVAGPGGGATTAIFPTNILDSSTWNTRAINNLIGPQIGGRIFHQRGRWITSIEARFLAAANFHNLTQITSLGNHNGIENIINLAGTNILTNFRGLGADTHQYTTTFSPLGELRVNAAWQATSNVALKVGYTGIVVGNISRASNRVDYNSPNLIGILSTGFHQSFFSNGLNFGVEVNR